MGRKGENMRFEKEGIGVNYKNNEKIMEGDIVTWNNNFGEKIVGYIRFTKVRAAFTVVLIKGGNATFYEGNIQNFAWGDLEKVGTRYINPERMSYEYWKKQEEIEGILGAGTGDIK